MKSFTFGLRPAVLMAMGVIALVVGSANVDASTSSNQVSTHPSLSVQAAAPPCGDLNGDSAVNILDAIILLQFIVGLITPDATQEALADVNQSGTVGDINILDAITLLQIIVGLIPPESVVCGTVSTGPVSPAPVDLLATSDTGASDTDGNSALSNTLVFELVPDTFAPTITLITPGDGQEWAEGLSAVQVRFNEAIDAATVNAANFQLKDSGGAVVAPLVVALGNRDRTVLMTYPPQSPGSYSVVIDAAQVTDRAGNALGAADIVSQFTLVQATVFWVGSSGFWDETAHWSTGVVPGPTDKVFIGSVVGNITVTHRSGTDSVTSINSQDTS